MNDRLEIATRLLCTRYTLSYENSQSVDAQKLAEGKDCPRLFNALAIADWLIANTTEPEVAP